MPRPAFPTISRALTIGFAMLLGSFALSQAAVIFIRLSHRDIWFNDFFGIWSFAEFAIAKSVVELYDNLTLLEFQVDLGACPKCLQPYAYPPFFIFLLFPLGFLDYYYAYPLWTGISLILYLVFSFHRRANRYINYLIVLAPTTIVSIETGQTGLLSSALILGGFRLVATRPIVSGALFGLASFKPQLGILIPIALVSARLWLPLAAAGVTIALLVLASGAAFGWWIWPWWLAKVVSHADWITTADPRSNLTITSNLISLGADLAVSRTVQACFTVLVAVTIWICFRGGVTILATAALYAGTFLATPYCMAYDLSMSTNAVCAVLHHSEQTNRALTAPEIVILASALIVPVMIIESWKLSMIRSIPLILLFGLIIRRMSATPRPLQI